MAMVAPSRSSFGSNGTSGFSRPSINGHGNNHNNVHDDLVPSSANTPIDSPMVVDGPTLSSNTAPTPTIAASHDHIQATTYKPPEKFHRVDTLYLKRKLFEALGSESGAASGESEHARLYWTYLGQFVRGRLRREEFIELISEILDDDSKVTLHNHLLTAVLHNAASTQPIATTPTLPATQTTTERITHDPTDTSAKNTQDPSTTLLGIVDATPATLGGSAPHPSSPSKQLSIASVPDTLPRRTRVREWLSGLNRAERDRLKRLPTQESERYDERNTLNKTVGEMQRGYQGRGRLRLNSKPLRPNVLSSLNPLAQSTGYVPSQRQIKDRLNDLAKLNGMTEGVAEGMDELLGAALDTHLDSLFCGAIEVKLGQTEHGDARSTSLVAGEHKTSTRVDDEEEEESIVDKGPSLPPPTRPPHPSSPRFAGLAILKHDNTYELAPPSPIRLELQDFQSLFTAMPQVHAHLGSAVWGLKNGIGLREEQLEGEAREMEDSWKTNNDREVDRALEGLFSKKVNGNAKAGPGPSSSALASTRPKLGLPAREGERERELPTLSRPPTPVTTNGSLPASVGASAPADPAAKVPAERGGDNEKSTAIAGVKRPGEELDRFGVRPNPPGPGGIVPRPSSLGLGLGLGLSRGMLNGGGRIIPSHLQQPGSSAGVGGHVGTRREMIQRELEVRKLYKVMDGRPMIAIPPIPANQSIGTGDQQGMTSTVAAALMAASSAASQNINPGQQSATRDGQGQDGKPTTTNGETGLPRPVHGPNHWPYVDPASIFKDILG